MPENFIRGDGKPRQRIYRVTMPQTELWQSYDGTDKDIVEIEIFEHWLEPAE